MKKIWIVLLIITCFMLVGCGNKDSLNKNNYNILTCVQKDDEGKFTIKVYQDKKTYEFKKVEMTDVVSKASVEEMGYSKDEFLKVACDNENYSNCSFKEDGDNYVGKYDYNAEAFANDILNDEDYQIDKIDATTFTTIASIEKNGGGMACSIS